MSTRKAKPNGQFVLHTHIVQEFLDVLSVKDLPGVGWATHKELVRQGVRTVRELRQTSVLMLQQWFGENAGPALLQKSQGIDDTPLKTQPAPRKSIGAQVSWGVRFSTVAQVEVFVRELCAELNARCLHAAMHGKTLTVKVWRKRENAREPAKFLGHGSCDHLSKSVNLPQHSADVDMLARHTLGCLKALKIEPELLRGLGVQLTKLESTGTPSNGGGQGSLSSFFGESGSGHDKHPVPCAVVDGRRNDGLCVDDERGSLLVEGCSGGGKDDSMDSVVVVDDDDQDVDGVGTSHNMGRLLGPSTTEPTEAPAVNVPASTASYMPSSSQLDPAVLSALPLNLRQEITKAASSVSALRKHNADMVERSRWRKGAMDHNARLPGASDLVSASSGGTGSDYHSYTNVGDVALLRRNISRWMTSVPTPSDVGMFADVARNLVSKGSLDDVVSFVRTAERASHDCDPKWRVFTAKARGFVSGLVFERWGCELAGVE